MFNFRSDVLAMYMHICVDLLLHVDKCCGPYFCLVFGIHCVRILQT
jgi:hypothetical protein